MQHMGPQSVAAMAEQTNEKKKKSDDSTAAKQNNKKLPIPTRFELESSQSDGHHLFVFFSCGKQQQELDLIRVTSQGQDGRRVTATTRHLSDVCHRCLSSRTINHNYNLESNCSFISRHFIGPTSSRRKSNEKNVLNFIAPRG